jgi:hypothetical protein
MTMKKSALSFLALSMAAGVALAQQPAKPAASAKPAVKSTAKAPAKTTTAKAAVKKAPVAKARAKAGTAAAVGAAAAGAAVAAGVSEEAALGAAELAIAERVHVGALPCELGNTVHLKPTADRPGHFDLQLAKVHYRLVPVVTSTGAIRLEDPKTGAVWLQLANKSMLMNHKLGQRMADECKSPAQVAVAEQFKLAPPPSVLDAAPAGAATAAPAAAPR